MTNAKVVKQMMSHTPRSKLDGGLQKLQWTDDEAVKCWRHMVPDAYD